jgi:hypothetical protein
MVTNSKEEAQRGAQKKENKEIGRADNKVANQDLLGLVVHLHHEGGLDVDEGAAVE